MGHPSNPQLEALVGKLFQMTDTLPGGTAGAVRYEQLTGDLLSETGHFQKASDMYKAISELLKSGDLSVHDQVVAKELLRDLGEVIGK